MALPLELKLDVVVLLTVRAALWNHIPQQVTNLRTFGLSDEGIPILEQQGMLLDGDSR